MNDEAREFGSCRFLFQQTLFGLAEKVGSAAKPVKETVELDAGERP